MSETKNEKQRKPHKSRAFYRFIWNAVKLVYPAPTLFGTEYLPDEPCVVVGNHSQMNGPIIAEIYYPRKRLIWCAWQMRQLRAVPAYAYEDFWSEKPKALRPLYKLLSYIIAPLASAVFTNADVIAVYHDTRVLSTFKQTVSALSDGTDMIIFPECKEPRNNIVYQFQENFVDVAKLYYKRTGKALCFVPMYLAPKLRQVHFGEPIRFDPSAPIADERVRVCDALAASITAIARALPEHTVIPYKNIPKKDYPKNR